MIWDHDEQHHASLRGHRIRITLRSIPGVLEDLEPAPRTGQGGGGTAHPLPISETVLDAQRDLKHTLVSWAKLVSEERHINVMCHDSTRALATWLEGHAEWLGGHDAGEDCEDEIKAAVAHLERLTDRPDNMVFAGNCPRCDTPAYAKEGRPTTYCLAPRDDDPRAACGEIISVEQGRAELLARATEMTASAADIARLLDVKPATIRQWGRRGKLGGYCDVTTRETRWLIGSVMDQLAKGSPVAA